MKRDPISKEIKHSWLLKYAERINAPLDERNRPPVPDGDPTHKNEPDLILRYRAPRNFAPMDEETLIGHLCLADDSFSSITRYPGKELAKRLRRQQKGSASSSLVRHTDD